MSIVAVLPMKSFSEAKQRLRDELMQGHRRALVEAMFSDVLLALRRARSIDRVAVVSADHVAQQIAGGYGATVLDDLERGHNAAAAVGIEAALHSGADRVLLVPGDCPLLDPTELDGLTARAASSNSALIVPDRHKTGTNALLLTPPDSLEPSFGPGSCERHAQAARSRGNQSEVVPVPTLALDIDTPEDLAALRETLAVTRGGAARTRGLLNQLNRTRSA